MSRTCLIILSTFAAAYLIALGLFLIGTFGLLGQDRDPLSGVFLIPLGLPWNRLIGGAPESALPWLAAAAPAVNLVLLRLLCGRFGAPS